MKKIFFAMGIALLVVVAGSAQAQVSCSTPGANSATCIPSGAGNAPVSAGGCPNGADSQGACNLGYTPLEPIPGINTNAAGQALNFPQLLGNIYKVAIVIGALFSVLMLTVSGIRYMLSDIVTDKEKAKKRITACIYGLVLIAASWLILNTINPQLVNFNLNPGSATVNAPTVNNTLPTPTNPTALPPDLAQAVQNVQSAQTNATDCTDARTVLDPNNQTSCFSLAGIKNMLSQGISCSQYQSQLQQEQVALQQYVNNCANAGL